MYRLACHLLLPWLRLTFAIVTDAAWPGWSQWLWVGGSAGSPQCVQPMGCCFFAVPRPPYMCTCVRCPRLLGSCSPVCPLSALCCACFVLSHLALVHRCARSVCCVVCAVSWASWLLFTTVPAGCVVSHVRCPGPLGSCSPAGPLVRCFACAVSWATWLLFTGVPSQCVVLRVRCPWPLGSHFTGVHARFVVLLVRCPEHLAPVHRCARSVCCAARAVSWTTCVLCTGVPARCVVSRVRCPGPLGSCSPVRQLGALLCSCGVLGHWAPVHRCASSVRCDACVVSWATWLLFTGVPARCVALHVRCPWPIGSCSTVCPCGLLCCVCSVLGHLVPVHQCARWVCCFAAAVSWATWLLLTGVPARCVVLCV